MFASAKPAKQARVHLFKLGVGQRRAKLRELLVAVLPFGEDFAVDFHLVFDVELQEILVIVQVPSARWHNEVSVNARTSS